MNIKASLESRHNMWSSQRMTFTLWAYEEDNFFTNILEAQRPWQWLSGLRALLEFKMMKIILKEGHIILFKWAIPGLYFIPI